MQAFELRTGRLVLGTTLEIGGASCPDIITSIGTPSDMYITESDADVVAAFDPLIAGRV